MEEPLQIAVDVDPINFLMESCNNPFAAGSIVLSIKLFIPPPSSSVPSYMCATDSPKDARTVSTSGEIIPFT